MSIFTLVMLGESEVGKSSLVIRLVQDVFIAQYDDIEDAFRKSIFLDNQYALLLDILDAKSTIGTNARLALILPLAVTIH